MENNHLNTENNLKMNRQVDVKALVSHIIRGDGLDKCRICMGDTSQGQVHLGDTVMMDGEKPVTLSELLELITGVTVVTEEVLPPGLCIECSTAAIHAASFRSTVQNAQHQWRNITHLLEHIPHHKYSKESDMMYAFIRNNDIYLSDKCSNPSPDPIKADNDFSLKRNGKQNNCICPTCGKSFSYPLHLYNHLKQSADLVRACPICGRITSRDKLPKHLSSIHLIQPCSCEKCAALFLDNVQLKNHVVKAHGSGICTCGDCGRTFESYKAFHAHQSVHTLRSCPNCDTQFRNQSCYLYHIKKCCNIDPSKAKKSKITVTLKKKHNKKLKMGLRGSASNECICDYCKKRFAGKKFVAAHIKIVHTKDTHKPCIYCGRVFAAAHMTSHLKIHKPMMLECDQCGVILKTKLGFIQHKRLHTGEKPYPCKICDESFSAASRRSEHIRNAHKKSEIVLKHSCTYCLARFRLPNKLKQHTKTVHGDNGSDKSFEWKCEKCEENFKSFRSLVYHSKIHKS